MSCGQTWTDMLKEFHKGCDVDDPQTPSIPPQEKVDLRIKLIKEEYEELVEDELELPRETHNIEKIAKEISDLIYVLIGTALAYGIPMDKVFEEVHRSNMSKLVDGKIIKRADGKVLKPPTYSPADMSIIWGYK